LEKGKRKTRAWGGKVFDADEQITRGTALQKHSVVLWQKPEVPKHQKKKEIRGEGEGEVGDSVS